jgi:hypothetical protein
VECAFDYRTNGAGCEYEIEGNLLKVAGDGVGTGCDRNEIGESVIDCDSDRAAGVIEARGNENLGRGRKYAEQSGR